VSIIQAKARLNGHVRRYDLFLAHMSALTITCCPSSVSRARFVTAGAIDMKLIAGSSPDYYCNKKMLETICWQPLSYQNRNIGTPQNYNVEVYFTKIRMQKILV
jgi:hypothetical protein